jgi:hypothetical protein
VLDFDSPLIPVLCFPGIPFQCIEVIHPEIRGHYFKPVLFGIVIYQREGEGNVKFIGVIPFSNEDKAGETAGVFQGDRKAGPESPSRPDLPVIGAAVVVGAYSGSRSQVGESLDQGSDEKGIVMMLLMDRKDEVVEDLAAGDRGVVPQYRMNKPGAVFKIALFSYDETHCLGAIEDVAAVTYDAVYQFHPFAYLGGLLL